MVPKKKAEISGTNTEGLGDTVVLYWPRNDLLVWILPSKMIKTKLKTSRELALPNTFSPLSHTGP